MYVMRLLLCEDHGMIARPHQTDRRLLRLIPKTPENRRHHLDERGGIRDGPSMDGKYRTGTVDAVVLANEPTILQ